MDSQAGTARPLSSDRPQEPAPRGRGGGFAQITQVRSRTMASMRAPSVHTGANAVPEPGSASSPGRTGIASAGVPVGGGGKKKNPLQRLAFSRSPRQFPHRFILIEEDTGDPEGEEEVGTYNLTVFTAAGEVDDESFIRT